MHNSLYYRWCFVHALTLFIVHCHFDFLLFEMAAAVVLVVFIIIPRSDNSVHYLLLLVICFKLTNMYVHVKIAYTTFNVVQASKQPINELTNTSVKMLLMTLITTRSHTSLTSHISPWLVVLAHQWYIRQPSWLWEMNWSTWKIWVSINVHYQCSHMIKLSAQVIEWIICLNMNCFYDEDMDSMVNHVATMCVWQSPKQ